MAKKPYNPPAITTHGNALEQTKGFGGEYWEFMNPKASDGEIKGEPPKGESN